MAKRIWVTADTHFGHAAAIGLFARPISAGDVIAMDEFLLDRINSRVGRGDHLLHLGDFTGPRPWKGEEGEASLRYAAELRGRIFCKRIELVRGNHDPSRKRLKDLFDDVHDLYSFRGWTGGDERIVCCHYPMRTWQGIFDGAVHLYGHAHGTFEAVGRSCDVGVDCWQYGPVLLDEVVARLMQHSAPTREESLPRRQPMRTPESHERGAE
ncbi:MAG: metallophosphoesterase [Phycisphaerales bacterium]|nr:metallophosphoesterase [Phycisphaerales bacterium]